MRVRRSVPWMIVCGLAAGAGAASPPTLSASVDRDTITVGDHFTLTLQVTRDPEVELLTALNAVSAQLQHFEVKDYKTLEDLKAPEGKKVEGMAFTLSTYVSGDYPIPPLPVAYRLPSGATGVVFTDVMTIHVKSVLPVDDTGLELRDIQPPVVAEPTGALQRLLLQIGLAVVVLGGAIGALIYWLTRPRRIELPPEPAHVIALRRLAELRGSDAYRSCDAGPFAVELSDLLRRYLGDRWGLNAIDLTTTEIGQLLSVAGVPATWEDRIMTILRATDRVKFANLAMPHDEMTEHLDTLEEFIQQTIPVAAPATDKPLEGERALAGAGEARHG